MVASQADRTAVTFDLAELATQSARAAGSGRKSRREVPAVAADESDSRQLWVQSLHAIRGSYGDAALRAVITACLADMQAVLSAHNAQVREAQGSTAQPLRAPTNATSSLTPRLRLPIEITHTPPRAWHPLPNPPPPPSPPQALAGADTYGPAVRQVKTAAPQSTWRALPATPRPGCPALPASTPSAPRRIAAGNLWPTRIASFGRHHELHRFTGCCVATASFGCAWDRLDLALRPLGPAARHFTS